MSESDRKDPQEPQEKPPVTYASPIQRIWAWVGVVYMLLLLLLFTYFLATGTFIQGITGIMIAPALWGVARMALLQRTDRRNKNKDLLWLLTVAVCAAFIVVGVLSSLRPLLAAFGG